MPSLFHVVQPLHRVQPGAQRHGGAAEDYPWSSYCHHAGIRPDGLMTDHAKVWALGNTPFQREAAYAMSSRR
jgi:hypothetical protein